MTLPPESYNPKALQDIEDSIAAAKKIINEQGQNSGETELSLGDIATMAETVVAERLLLEQEPTREPRQDSIGNLNNLIYKYDDLIQEDINII